MSAVSWRIADGRRPIIDVLIFAPENRGPQSLPAQALIDTGSTTSAITSDLAERLDLPVLGRFPIASAHGDQLTERYLFGIGLMTDASDDRRMGSLFTFGDLEGFRIRSGFSFNALIGMDVLSRCDFSMKRSGDCRLAFGR